MVAVIHQSSSLRNILNYNEQKVKQGAATCLEAGCYPAEAADLNFQQKLRRLEMLAELNEKTKVNSVHISLNFDPSETLSDELLKEIAEVYLEKIGFGQQPYLLYKHLDSGHPHVHLVTTNIKPSGKRISLHNLFKPSKKARLEIEQAYRLVKADEAKEREALRAKPVNALKVIYGKSETKRAIGNVLTKVLKTYAYNSLPELNAILKLYNVVADPGSEGSRTSQYEGLVYRVLDEQGNKIGTPIKASLYNWDKKPGLKFLKERFAVNAPKKTEAFKTRVKNAIDLALLRDKMDLKQLMDEMKKDGIDVVVRQNADGVIYGLTYVDHVKAVVFNGSDLGKGYSAKGILERCTNGVAGQEKIKTAQAEKQQFTRVQPGERLPDLKDLTDALLVTDDEPERMDWALKRSQKKKKRQRIVPD